MAKTKTVYQLKVTMKDIKPAIWRRLQVPADIKLGALHMALQDALGWTNSHLHQFTISRDRYGMIDLDEPDADLLDENRHKLSEVATAKSRLGYEYDFGDGWEHDILVEKIVAADQKVRYPVCLDGKRACPPEDCGGPYGYGDFLEALADPSHERHEELLEWIGGPFDPERFDVDEINALMRPARGRGARSTQA